MDRHLNDRKHYAVISIFLVLAHVQALDGAYIHSLSYIDHGSSPAESLSKSLVQSPGRKLTALTEEFRFSRAAATSRRGEESDANDRRGREEVEALLSFRAAILGDMAAFRSWDANDSNPCGWVGVSCLSSKEHVTALNLSNHQLAGSINSALLTLGKLQSLESLDLSGNSFSSFISGPTLVNFSSLAYLNLSYNQIGGEIPDQVGELAHLQSLILERNNLSGRIPPSICNCTSLRVFNLQSNFLRGPIPHLIGRLAHLQILLLGSPSLNQLAYYIPSPGNQITGSIPPSLGNCSSLTVIALDDNQELRGRLPHELSRLHYLQVLSLARCNLEDVLPRWIGNLTNLVNIELAINHFYGPIPSEFGRLPNLSTLALGKNNLTGEIPPEIGNCTSLAVLTTSDNSLSGVIPSGLGDCKLLQKLYLGENPLMDPASIPSWISSMEQLIFLDFSDMNLHGEIPKDIGRLSNLQWLSFEQNALTGSIPTSLSNCSSLAYLFLNLNNLTGRIPSEIGDLTDLFSFLLQYNSLTGWIPTSITNMTRLLNLDVRHNSLGGTLDGQWPLLPLLAEFLVSDNLFVGSIPGALGNCSNLVLIHLAQNFLTGGIPASFGNLSALEWLDVSKNRISGRIPIDLARCFSLERLHAFANILEGPLPPEIGSIPFLRYVEFNNNKLSGMIADPLANMTAIVGIGLSYNRFSGTVPERGVSQMQSLTIIDLSHNFLSGSLSTSWSSLQSIQEIDISANNISGSLPNPSNWRSLQRLDVSLNNFSGDIPESLAALPDLVFFNASFNNFVGPIPASEVFNSNTTPASFLGNPGLCGHILGPSRECPILPSNSSEKCKQFQCPRVYVPVSVAGVICVVLVAAVAGWVIIRRAVKKAAKEKEVFDILLNLHPDYLRFAPTDILAIIRDEENIIGTGGKCVVYKGSLPGCDMVAIKTFVDHRMDPGAPELWRNLLEQEANIQARLRHRNVVKVLSFCSNLDFRALLLEYMPQGSLYDHLYPPARGDGAQLQRERERAGPLEKNCVLSWSARFGIAIDVAEGLTYLHHDCPEPLIHGDLKPSNILLDAEMVAKVSDFGISKLVNPQREGEHGEATVSRTCGTIGYMPPEYAFATHVSTKGDVFGYGVVLLEMLSGSPPVNTVVSSEATYRDWHLKHFQESPIVLLDPLLQQEGKMDELKYKQMMLLARIAFFSTRESPESRPSMKDVRSMLMQIKDLGAGAVTRRTVDELAHETVDEWENQDPDDAALPSISD